MEKLYLKSYFLIKLGFLKNNSIFKNYLELLKALSNNDFEEILKKYNLFLASLENKDFSKVIKQEIVNFNYDEIVDEIEILKEIINFDFEDLKSFLVGEFDEYFEIINQMPKFINSKYNFERNDFNNQNTNLRTFFFNKNLCLEPIFTKESLTFYDLKGYKEQKRILYDNTLALLEGKKVNNILLYGDAGCGKSSSIRALLNEFEEIRIVQIFKDNLINLDKLYLILKDMPYKFIIFADDISFDEDDKELSTMKAVLEGSLITCPSNVVIYATSNRRHLVKESFKARQGDEIHLQDTINEINSLSDRFGINILFNKPSKKEFDEIVLELAKDNNIEDKDLLDKANKLSIVKGSKSPRVARQLIDSIITGVNLF